MRGTRSTSSLSLFQCVLMASAWIAGVLALVLAAPHITSQLLSAVLAVAVIGMCWVITIRIMRNPSGRRRVEITTYEGLRGSFVVHQFGWYLLLAPAISLTAVAITLLRETPRFAALPAAWALVGLAALVVIGGPLALICGRVRAFRVDADGQLWVRCRGRWDVLHLATFAQVRGYSIRAMRGAVIPSRVVCSGGTGRLRRVVFVLDAVVSRDYGTRVPAGVLSAFLQDACERAGLTLRSVGRRGDTGWIATGPDVQA